MKTRTLVWGVVAAMLLNAGLVGAYSVLSGDARVYPRGTQFPELAGTDLDGHMYEATGAACYVIRITSDNCQFCAKDQPSYNKFVEAARTAGCHTLELAPYAGQMAASPRDSITQIKFVDMQLGEALYPFLTPQTIVLDSSRKVTWARPGMFSSDALNDGIAVLETLTSRR